MGEWKKIRFGDLYAIPSRNGVSKPSRIRGAGYKMINMGELFAHDWIFDIPMELVPLTDSEKANSQVVVDDLLFARQSMVASGAGRCVIVREVNELTVFESHLIRVRLDQAKALPLFYYYYFRSGCSNIASIVQHVVQAGIRASDLSDLEVDLPDLPTQRRIAAVLGALDDKIEVNRKICENLEAQAQALFKAWFVDFEPFGGKRPDGWKEIPLFAIADFYGGYSYKGAELQDSDCAMVTIKNFDRGGGFKLNGFKEIVPSSKLKHSHEVDLFDTLVAHTDLTQNAEVIGNAEMLLSKAGYKKIIMSMDLVKVVPKHGISRFLLGALLKNGVFKSHCLRYVNGTTVLHLSKMALTDYTLDFPDDPSVLDSIAQTFESIYRKIAVLIDEFRALVAMRDALLPKLMSGELAVEKVEAVK